ncbi:DDE-type integrase/transposase/recombinase [Paludibacterium denitrificans]|uniref:DDE-type integrase/transposase/recombinase n=1 Tax=Paludibacterium denitrificans TaxID=2675226 RepID=UPI001E4B27A1|nr:DDE-type integrase/transposase/recombinase [Paludibacterium denitrificans]
MAFEAYSVAIKLSLTNMVSSGLGMIAKDLTGLEKNVVSLQDKFKALKMIGVGWGLSHIGSSMFGFMGKTVEASKEYTRQLSLMSAAGMSQLEIAKATSSAWQTSKDVITSSASANLTAIRELRSVFGKDHMSEAYALLPQVQRTKSIMEALTGKEQHGVAFDMSSTTLCPKRSAVRLADYSNSYKLKAIAGPTTASSAMSGPGMRVLQRSSEHRLLSRCHSLLGEVGQFDWSYEHVVLGGVTQTIKLAHFRLTYSRQMFVVAYPRETREMVFDAHRRAFAFFGGVPHKMVYDNLKTVVETVFA